MAKILIVEDEVTIAEIIKAYLIREYHTVEQVSDGTQALERLKLYKYDVIILDWMLPDISGVEICQQFRATGGSTPILMLTAKQHIQEKVYALDAGADDYLTKPFELPEMAARVRAMLRRPQEISCNTLQVRNMVLDPATFRLTKNGQDIQLLPKEFALLEFFMRHPNQVFSAESILDRVWSADSEASPETIRTYIKKLRQKIDTPEQPSIISTVHGVGYKLEDLL